MDGKALAAIAEAVLCLAGAEAAIRLLPFRWVARMVGRPGAESPAEYAKPEDAGRARRALFLVLDTNLRPGITSFYEGRHRFRA
jgi:hypothetical protein